MNRKKKESRAINCMIRKDICDKLDKYAEIKGQTKTIVIERALEKVFNEEQEMFVKEA